MHSSETIGALAAALAKAQAELTNPDKSMLAILTSDRAGQGARSFRYAPLASGLDIVRKTLSRHQLAVVQTTDIDPPTRTIRLRTTLAHASGEWMASEWPVCSVGDVSAPQRMGTALTYARRYALFALVGIAGEDDLDAPDLALAAPPLETPTPEAQQEPRRPAPLAPPTLRTPKQLYGKPRPARIVLAPDSSASLRDQLLAACAKLSSVDDAVAWARQTLKVKNTLCPADADALEAAYREKMSTLPGEEERGLVGASESPTPVVAQAQIAVAEPTSIPNSGQIDKSKIAIASPTRRRDKAHLRFVSAQPCLVCGRRPADPHHLRFAQPRALGRKVSDEFTVPVCRSHHRELHRSGDEASWWARTKIDPLAVARDLWAQTRRPRGRPRKLNGVSEAPTDVLPPAP